MHIIRKDINIEYNFTKFSIDYSSYEGGYCNSTTPPDICICNEYLMELSNPKNLRYKYPFITCAEEPQCQSLIYVIHVILNISILQTEDLMHKQFRPDIVAQS
jgi:hypothetical protein